MSWTEAAIRMASVAAGAIVNEPRHWDSRDYLRWHQDRCAAFAADWLREQGADVALVEEVE